METMKKWNRSDVSDLLRSYGFQLADFDVKELQRGSDNLNLVITVDKEKFVLRRYDITSQSEIEFELALVTHLVQKGFPTPPVLSHEKGDLWTWFCRKPAALFRFVDGIHPDVSSWEAVGRAAVTVANFHLMAADFECSRVRSRTDYERIKRLQTLCREKPSLLLTDGLSGLLDDIRDFELSLKEKLRFAGSRIPVGVVHHDLNPDNFLYDEFGEVVALLDFDESHVSCLLVDLASLIHYWAMEGSSLQLNISRAAHIISAYQAIRSLSSDEMKLLGDFVLFFLAADAAEYVTRQLTYRPADIDVQECKSYRAFAILSKSQEWRKCLAP